MDDRHVLLRLWILGTIAMMALSGGLTGTLLRQWQQYGPAMLPPPTLSLALLVPVLALMSLWFCRGFGLWRAVKAKAR